MGPVCVPLKWLAYLTHFIVEGSVVKLCFYLSFLSDEIRCHSRKGSYLQYITSACFKFAMVPLGYMKSYTTYIVRLSIKDTSQLLTVFRILASKDGQVFLLNPGVYNLVRTPYRICLYQSNAFKCGEKYTLRKNWGCMLLIWLTVAYGATNFSLHF
jgi:hypothetical protein